MINFYYQSLIWLPCVADYRTGGLIPLSDYQLNPKESEAKDRNLIETIKTKPWNHEEDLNLKELILKFGKKKWTKISKILNEKFNNSRKGRNCRERWNNYLDPDLNKGEWQNEEDLKLLMLHQKIGRKWSMISKEIFGRTENAVKFSTSLLSFAKFSFK